MKFFTQILTYAALITSVLAQVEIRFYSNTLACSGAYVYVYGVAANSCISVAQTGYGYSVHFFNIPTGGKGQAYSNTVCSAYILEVYQGTSCRSSAGNWRARSANWFYSSKRLAVRDETPQETKSGLQYTTPEGVSRRIECSGAELDEVAALALAEDYEALSKYPDGMLRSLDAD